MATKNPFLYNYKIILTPDMVIDGDSLGPKRNRVKVDLGFHVQVEIPKGIRLYGINTPETRTRDLEEKNRGLAAKKYLQDLVSNGDEFILSVYDLGKYGRMLADLWIDNLNASDLLINSGHGVPYYI